MSRSTQADIDRLLDAAEAARTCLAAPDCPDGPVAQRLRRRSRGGSVLSPYEGVYVRAERWRALDPCERDRWAMRALTALHPGWVFCGVSAAEAHGLWVSWHRCQALSVTHLAGQGGPAQPGGHHEHGSPGPRRVAWRRGPAASCTVVGGVRATSLDETAVDCLRELPFAEGLGVADSWARLVRGDRLELLGRVERLGKGRKGAGQARATAAHADARSENGGESFARARIIELGYATPDLQVEARDPLDPGHVMRVDFVWEGPRGQRILGELDGLVKYTDPGVMGQLDSEQVRAQERLRESRLALPGSAVMRFSLADVRDTERFDRLLRLYDVPRRPTGRGVGGRRAGC